MPVWRKDSWCLEIKFGIFLVLILMNSLINFGLVSAVRINEVELNPAGTDTGNEWVELLSDEETNLDNYKLVNNDGDEFLLNNYSISDSSYLVIVFEKQWLDNSDEKVYLYENNNLIDETIIFEDNKNNDKTWQFCGDGWIFINSTEEQENNCPQGQEEKEPETEPEEPEPEQEEEEQEPEQDEGQEGETEKIVDEQPKSQGENIINKQEIIKLNNPKDIKSKGDRVLYNSTNEKIKKYAIYGFALFCVFIIIFLSIRKI